MKECIEHSPIEEIFQMILLSKGKIKLLLGLNMEDMRRKFEENSDFREGMKRLTEEGY